MRIYEVKRDKKEYIDLLLLGDEQESMIDTYLERGTMYVLDGDGIKSECVVTDEGNGILEIKNIATIEGSRGKGYGKALIDYLADKYAELYKTIQVGTGDIPSIISFYEKCGFTKHHKVERFFTDNYDHPIYECGIQLIDMIYLRRELANKD